MAREPIGRVDHVGFAVRSIAQARGFFEGVLGARFRFEAEGRGGSFRFAVFDLGGFTIEVLEPARPDGFVARFLDKRGEGFHHMTIQVKDLARRVRQLEAEGLRVVDQSLDGPSWLDAFISPRSACGVLIQLAETCPPLDNEPYWKLGD